MAEDDDIGEDPSYLGATGAGPILGIEWTTVEPNYGSGERKPKGGWNKAWVRRFFDQHGERRAPVQAHHDLQSGEIFERFRPAFFQRMRGPNDESFASVPKARVTPQPKSGS
ncbi:MAG: hypothetical protein AAGL92_12975, partial [Pseudomonadota bacterium]